MSDDVGRLLEARCHDPFRLLGPQRGPQQSSLRVLLPAARSARIADGPPLRAVAPMLFEWSGPAGALPEPYQILWTDGGGNAHREFDPYQFPPQPEDLLAPFEHDQYHLLPDRLGSRTTTRGGVPGVRFAVWAPHAERVSVVGEFNAWDGRRLPMQALGSSGVWWLFVPGLGAGTTYRYEIRHRNSGAVVVKSDPLARAYTPAPRLESTVTDPPRHHWQDAAWMAGRGDRGWRTAPMAVYEMHLGSWREAHPGEPPLRSLAVPLAEHLSSLGFTHVELLPVMEHPFGGSWGYQTLGYFAPAQRFGSAEDLCAFVDTMHGYGIGVMLDWTPAHFPRDACGLAWFDGEPLYEYADPRLAVHPDWDTAVFDYGRDEVCAFLLASAVYWVQTFHADGLRVDAVASMLYRDYSRAPGTWSPNRYGGRENLEAIGFLRRLNDTIAGQCPGALTIAEESTSWPMVTRPTAVGGLGFSLKWNLGWMHDTLDYLRLDPIYRAYHHDKLTFGITYAASEQFMLPFSHDEVVHGKSSLLHKLPGDDWQKFATLRLLYCYLYGFPGKKLLFMGAELGVRAEWDHQAGLNWSLLEHASHQGLLRLLGDLNRLYRSESGLHDDGPGGFQWIDCHDHGNSVVSFLRRNGTETLVLIVHFTPVPRYGYRIGVPEPGRYRELLNSDSSHYGGSNVGNNGCVDARPEAWMGKPACLDLTLPPLGALVLKRRPADAVHPGHRRPRPATTYGGDAAGSTGDSAGNAGKTRPSGLAPALH